MNFLYEIADASYFKRSTRLRVLQFKVDFHVIGRQVATFYERGLHIELLTFCVRTLFAIEIDNVRGGYGVEVG